MGDEPYPPHVCTIYIHQYRFVKFLFIACKSFQEILYRGIDKLYTWCMLQHLVEEGNQAAYKEQGRYPANKDNQQDKDNNINARYINTLIGDNGTVGK